MSIARLAQIPLASALVALACAPRLSPPPPDAPRADTVMIPFTSAAPASDAGSTGDRPTWRAATDRFCEGYAPPTLSGCREIGRVRVRSVSYAPTCHVETLLQDGDEGRVLECPDGAAIDFTDVTFAGQLDNGRLTLCAPKHFTYQAIGPCEWRTAQHLEGRPGLLRFSYAEEPTSGVGCGTPCPATGVVEGIQP